MAKPPSLPDDIRPNFHGFPKEGLAFLRGLARNNDRAWFRERQETYEARVRFPMECLLAEFAPSCRPRGFPLQGHPRHGLFRIHRDVRFSKDKAPYKTHAGAVLTRSGRKGDPGLLYVHVEPGASFLAAGFYSTPRAFLHAWRTRIAEDPDGFLAIAAPFTRKGARYRLRSRSAVKTMPRGFSSLADSPVAEYLRWEHCMLVRDLPDQVLAGRALVAAVRGIGAAAGELLEFGWEVEASLRVGDPRPGAPRPAASR